MRYSNTNAIKVTKNFYVIRFELSAYLVDEFSNINVSFTN